MNPFRYCIKRLGCMIAGHYIRRLPAIMGGSEPFCIHCGKEFEHE